VTSEADGAGFPSVDPSFRAIPGAYAPAGDLRSQFGARCVCVYTSLRAFPRGDEPLNAKGDPESPPSPLSFGSAANRQFVGTAVVGGVPL
jgi:hypothetical protein